MVGCFTTASFGCHIGRQGKNDDVRWHETRYSEKMGCRDSVNRLYYFCGIVCCEWAFFGGKEFRSGLKCITYN